MEHFAIYQPMAKGKTKIDKIEILAELIPKGKENAITRDELLDKCIENGLVKEDSKRENQDRAMRKLIQKAKLDYSITNDADGSGYYRPTKEDYQRLRRNHNREKKKGISTIVSEKYNGATIEDYKHGRIAGDA
jgi:hypothetical protein